MIQKGLTINEYRAARYPYLWIQTTEDDRIIRTARRQTKEAVTFFQWDNQNGFQIFKKTSDNGWRFTPQEEKPTQDPATALTMLPELPPNSIYFMKDFHRYFTDIMVIRPALNLKELLKSTGRMIVFISSEPFSTGTPSELKNDIVPFFSPLPTRQELTLTVKRVAGDNKINVTPEETEIFANALIGLTEESAENALSLCLVTERKFNVRTLLREKARLIESIAGLTYQEYEETLDDLAGLRVLINYLLKAAPNPLASSILLYGIPGTGKSHAAKALANALKVPCIAFNLANVRTKYQGETESNLERSLATIDAIGKCIVFCDEIDKAIIGAEGGADSDAGAGSRIVGRLLQYFADRTTEGGGGAYWIMTANSLAPLFNISGGAMIRRFDALFFLDMPSAQERRQIVKIWNGKLKVNIPENYNLEGFTGADIKKLATQMLLLESDVDTARRYVIPTRQALGAKIDEIRKAAMNTCIPASEPETTTPQRKVDI